MTISEERILKWFEDKSYGFFDDIDYDESKEIYDDDDIQNLALEAERFADKFTGKSLTDTQKDSFNDTWKGKILPDWKDIADKNKDKLEAEIKATTKDLRDRITSARTPEDRKEFSEQLRSLNARSFGQLRTTEIVRGKRAFRQMFG